MTRILRSLLIILLLLIMVLSYLDSKSHKDTFVFPGSDIDTHGEFAYVWRNIYINERINLGVSSYKVEFYTTSSSLDEIITYFNQTLDWQKTSQIFYDEF